MLHKKYQLTIMLFLTLMLSCKKTEFKDPNLRFSVSEIDTSRVVIFNYDVKDKECKKIFQEGENSKLRDSDLMKIEDALNQIIDNQNRIQVKLFEQYSKNYPEQNYLLQDFIIKDKNYVRRYLVIENSKGEKEIYVSLICDDIAKEINWKKYLPDGHGGGSCLFSFKLNLSTNKYYDVYFHADA